MSILEFQPGDGAKDTGDKEDKTAENCARTVPLAPLPASLKTGAALKMDGRDLLAQLPEASVEAAFFDPQYRGVLEKLAYGNEGIRRGRKRAALEQMQEPVIRSFIDGIASALAPSGHLFMWVDKFHLCEGVVSWFTGTSLQIVDLVTWKKGRIGMGYRTRRIGEYAVVLQKNPKRAKGIWRVHDIPDVWKEKVKGRRHTHQKPLELQKRLIEAVTGHGGVVLDPAAGSFSVMQACNETGRVFIGCDLNPVPPSPSTTEGQN